MKTNEPLNKKTIAFAIIAFAVVFSVAFIKLEPKLGLVAKIKGSVSTKENEKLTNLDVNSAKIKSDIDSDSDGLLDWEEDLFGTMRDKKDSDGDGTLDGDEVNLERNPAISGSDSLSQKAVTINGSSKLSENENDFIKSLLGASYSLKNADGTTLEGATSKLTSIAEKSFTFKQYTFSDLKSISGSSSESLRFYGSAFATIQVTLLTDMAKNQDSIATNLKILGDIYAKAAKNLSEIAVPSDVLSIHLKIINNYSTVASAYYAFEEYRENPIKATIAIKAFTEASENHEKEVKTIASYLQQNGIIYSSQEVGGYWNRILELPE